MKRLCLVTFLIISCFATSQAADTKRGSRLYVENNCATCHARDGMGIAKVFNGKPKVDETHGPRIAGLDEKYIVEQMIAIQGKTPGHLRKTESTKEMKKLTKDLTKEEMADIAAFVARDINKPQPAVYNSPFQN